MNGIRAFASWAAGALRLSERTRFRILGAARAPQFNPSVESDRMNMSMLNLNQNYNLFPNIYYATSHLVGRVLITIISLQVNGLYTAKPHSNFSGSEFGKKSRTYWSAVAAGLLGIGGVSLLMKKENIFSNALFTTVHCQSNEKCDCKEKQCETSNCLRKTDKEEELIQKANQELERALRDVKGKAIEFTEAALKAYCDAIEAIKIFMNKVYCAVEEENLDSPRFEEVWCDVYDALTKRCDLAKQAMEKGQCAWELLRRLREVIENGKACKYTQCNPLLKTDEDTLICAEKELCSKEALMDQLLKESRVVEQYRNIIEEFRRDLKAEAESLVPSEECRVTLTDNEANMVLTHAYKKILRVQKELSKNTPKC